MNFRAMRGYLAVNSLLLAGRYSRQPISASAYSRCFCWRISSIVSVTWTASATGLNLLLFLCFCCGRAALNLKAYRPPFSIAMGMRAWQDALKSS